MRWNVWSFSLLCCLATIWTGCEGGMPSEEPDMSWQAVAAKYTCDPDNGGLNLPNGFCAFTVIDSLGSARHLAVRENGDIYVAIRNRPNMPGGIAALRDSDGDGRADVVERFGETGGTGIDLYQGYLYFGTDTSVVRYRLSDDALVPVGAPETIVTGLLEQGPHAAKPFAISPEGSLYLNIGAPSNACQAQDRTPTPGQDPCPELERQAGIWQFDASSPGQTQLGDGHRYATGIRNAMGIAWNPLTESLYATQHGRDMLFTLWGENFTREQSADLPSEEFFAVREGTNLGWPYCYYDHIQGRRVRAPEYGGDGASSEGCEAYDLPVVAFPGHYAPNDLLFVQGAQFPETYRGGALIAFHGSWNRSDERGQQGYKVAFVPMQGNQVTGEWLVFADGFAGTDHIENPNEAVYRPTGLAQGPDGTLYISDSVKGRIWRVIYTGETENIATN